MKKIDTIKTINTQLKELCEQFKLDIKFDKTNKLDYVEFNNHNNKKKKLYLEKKYESLEEIESEYYFELKYEDLYNSLRCDSSTENQQYYQNEIEELRCIEQFWMPLKQIVKQYKELKIPLNTLHKKLEVVQENKNNCKMR